MMNFTGPIDALEPSSEMWTIGQKTGIYSRYFDEPILENEVRWIFLKIIQGIFLHSKISIKILNHSE